MTRNGKNESGRERERERERDECQVNRARTSFSG